MSAMGLAAAYGALALLLLSLNLRAAWPWGVKAAAIVLTGALVVLSLIAIEGLLGWPTPRALPEQFRLHALRIIEPGRAEDGAIYLWVSALDAEPSVPPRAHALPYSRALHERASRLAGRLEDGSEIHGRLRPGDGERTPELELFEAPPARPADKGGRPS